MRDAFTRIAKQKINGLIKKNDFKQITSISDEGIILEYEDFICSVNSCGNVKRKDKENSKIKNMKYMLSLKVSNKYSNYKEIDEG